MLSLNAGAYFHHWNNPISDQLLESMEASKKIADSLAPILEQEEKLKRIAEGATAHIPNFEIPTLALDAISELSSMSFSVVFCQTMVPF